MIFAIRFSEEAEDDIKLLKRNEPQAYKKVLKLLLELQKHLQSERDTPSH